MSFKKCIACSRITRTWNFKWNNGKLRFYFNKKSFRTTPLDGATFPYKVKIEYNVNDRKYEKNKFIYWGDDSVNVGDTVIVTYKQSNPSKVLKLTKKK